MMKKIFATALAVILSLPAAAAYADEEKVTVNVELFNQNFENYTPQSDQNSVIGEEGGRALKFSSYNGEVQPRNYENISTGGVSGDVLEISLRLRIEEHTGWGMFFLQLTDGGRTRASIVFESPSGGGRHNMSLSRNVELLGRSELNPDEYNDIRLVFDSREGKRKTDVYLNGVYKRTIPYESLPGSVLPEFEFAGGTRVDTIKCYHYFKTRERGEENGVGEMFMDSISIGRFEEVSYDPDKLELSFESAVKYDGSQPYLVISNGRTSHALDSKIEVTLANVNTPLERIPLDEKSVTKNADGSGSFDFNSKISENLEAGYYNITVNQLIGGNVKKTASRRHYIATAAQLENLPVDFNAFKQSDDENAVKEKIYGYLPCFLEESVMNELFPKADGAWTEAAEENLLFFARYFMGLEKNFETAYDIGEEFNDAKIFLAIKNAEDKAAAEKILNSANYLDVYKDKKIYIENKAEFFSHFEVKKTEKTLLSKKDVCGALEYSYAMTLLNNSARSELEQLIKRYADIYGVDAEKYNVKGIVADDLYSAVFGKNYTNVSDIKKDLDDRLSYLLKKKNDETEKETRKSSGGGGGARVKLPINEQLPKPEIQPGESPGFSDIAGHWAENDINRLAANKVISGYDDKTFRPDGNVTRAELTVMLEKIVGESNAAENAAFKDVESGKWYAQAVARMAAKRFILGTDGYFYPDNPITRQDLAVILSRIVEKSAEEIAEPGFNDSEYISDYAKTAVSQLAANGILSGYEDKSFRPLKNISRAEAAALLCRVFGSKLN